MGAFVAIAAIVSALGLFGAGIAGANAETATAQELVARELAAVVSIAVLRPPAPPAQTMVAGTAAQSDAASAQHLARVEHDA